MNIPNLLFQHQDLQTCNTIIRHVQEYGTWNVDLIYAIYPTVNHDVVFTAALVTDAKPEILAQIMERTIAHEKVKPSFNTIDFRRRMHSDDKVIEKLKLGLQHVFNTPENATFECWDLLGKQYGHDLASAVFPINAIPQWMIEFARSIEQGYQNKNIEHTYLVNCITPMFTQSNTAIDHYLASDHWNYQTHGNRIGSFVSAWLSYAVSLGEIDTDVFISAMKTVNTNIVKNCNPKNTIEWVNDILFRCQVLEKDDVRAILEPLTHEKIYEKDPTQNVVDAYVKNMVNSKIPEFYHGVSWLLNSIEGDPKEYGIATNENLEDPENKKEFLYGQIQSAFLDYQKNALVFPNEIPFMDLRLYPYIVHGLATKNASPVWYMLNTPEVKALRVEDYKTTIHVLTHIWISTQKYMDLQSPFKNMEPNDFAYMFNPQIEHKQKALMENVDVLWALFSTWCEQSSKSLTVSSSEELLKHMYIHTDRALKKMIHVHESTDLKDLVSVIHDIGNITPAEHFIQLYEHTSIAAIDLPTESIDP